MDDKPAIIKRCSKESLLSISLLLATWFFYAIIFSELFARGFDLSDESFYLLHMRWWDDFAGGLSLFGAYLSIPYFVLGNSVLNIRLFGAILLWTTGYIFGRSLEQAYLSSLPTPGRRRLVAPAVIACLTFTYYWNFSLFTPSYNLLVLAALLMTTSQLFERLPAEWRWFNFLVYGFCFGALAHIKISAAALVLALQLTYLLLKGAGLRSTIILIGAGFSGLVLTCIGFRSFGVDVVDYFSWGWAFHQVLAPGNMIANLWDYVQHKIPNLFLKSLINLLPVIAAFIVVRVLQPISGKFASHAVLWSYILITLSALGFIAVHDSVMLYSKLVILALLVYGLFLLHTSPKLPGLICRRTSHRLAVPFTLMMLPLAYSFGTNNDLIFGASGAVVFPLSLIVVIVFRRIGDYQFSANTALIASSVFFSALPAVGLAKPWFDVEYTYRQPVSLRVMATPVDIGSGRLTIDSETATAISQLRNVLAERDVGKQVGMIDFTGRMPGLVYVSGGRPLGLAWILGGYPGSHSAAEMVLKAVSKAELESAVFFTATDQDSEPSLEWKRLVGATIDWTSTHQHACAIQFPNYMNRKQRLIDVWIPSSQNSPSESSKP